MALITKNNTSNGTGITLLPSYQVSWSHTVSSNDNRYIIVFIASYDGACSGVTIGGNAMTQLVSKNNGSYYLSIYGYLAPTSGSQSIIATFSQAGINVVRSSIDFYNVNQDNPIDNTADWSGTISSGGGSHSTDITTSYSNSYILDFCSLGDTIISASEFVGSETEYYDTIYLQAHGAGQYYGILSSAGTYGMEWTNNNSYNNASVAQGIIALRAIEVDLEQEGFAFGDDDGSESAHTLDTQDTNITEEVGTKTLRILVNSSDDPPSIAYKLKYQKNGSGGMLMCQL